MEALGLVVTAVGTAGGTALGAVLGLRGARAISREERAEAVHAETVRAFTGYVSALIPIVSELREVPPVPKASPIAEIVDQLRGEAATYIAARWREQELFGGRNREQGARLAAADIDLRLRPLPAGVRAAIDAANDYVERLSADRSEELIAEWPEIHQRLMAAGAELRGEEAVVPPTETASARAAQARARHGDHLSLAGAARRYDQSMSPDPLRQARAEVLDVLRGRAHGPWTPSEVDRVCEGIIDGRSAATRLLERGEVLVDQHGNWRVGPAGRSPMRLSARK
jgi:hypothetical protein